MSTKRVNPFAMVFPGQGSQSLNMLSDLSREYPHILQTFAEASEILNYDLWQLVQVGPEEKLNKTEYTQPALLAADIAVWRCWLAEGNTLPSILAGHSLGEYAALICAEAITFADAVLLVAKRGAYMQKAVNEGEGAMAAIIGLENDQIQRICDQVMAESHEVVSPANFNALGQTVIAGHSNGVDQVMSIAKMQGAKLVKRIPVSVPSHCSLMQEAAVALAKDLENVHINKPVRSVIHNFDVESHDDVETIRRVLTLQLTHAVRWVETIEKMAQQGVEFMVECGPGKVLTGLIKRITPTVMCYPAADLIQFNAAKLAISQ